MMALDLLVMMGGGAVFPYVAVATLDWARQRKAHPSGANAPR